MISPSLNLLPVLQVCRTPILYLAIAAIGTFATPSYELSLANRIYRIVLLLFTAWLGVIGFVAGITGWIIMLARMKSFNVPYLLSALPPNPNLFNGRALRDVLFRSPMPLKNRRPTFLHPQDPDR